MRSFQFDHLTPSKKPPFFKPEDSITLDHLLSNFRLQKEYKEFNNNKKTLYFSCPLIISANNYEKFCQILLLEDPIHTCKHELLEDIKKISGALAVNGALFSLQILYSDFHIKNKFIQFFNASLYENNDCQEWINSTITDLKTHAAAAGKEDILRNFFPEIITPAMLESILTVVQVAYNLGETFITSDDCLSLLSENLEGYKKSLQYLLKNGLDSYLADNNRTEAVPFCMRHKDSVPKPVQKLFEIIIDAFSELENRQQKESLLVL